MTGCLTFQSLLWVVSGLEQDAPIKFIIVCPSFAVLGAYFRYYLNFSEVI